jgi:hypothetical protein
MGCSLGSAVDPKDVPLPFPYEINKGDVVEVMEDLTLDVQFCDGINKVKGYRPVIGTSNGQGEDRRKNTCVATSTHKNLKRWNDPDSESEDDESDDEKKPKKQKKKKVTPAEHPSYKTTIHPETRGEAIGSGTYNRIKWKDPVVYSGGYSKANKKKVEGIAVDKEVGFVWPLEGVDRGATGFARKLFNVTACEKQARFIRKKGAWVEAVKACNDSEDVPIKQGARGVVQSVLGTGGVSILWGPTSRVGMMVNLEYIRPLTVQESAEEAAKANWARNKSEDNLEQDGSGGLLLHYSFASDDGTTVLKYSQKVDNDAPGWKFGKVLEGARRSGWFDDWKRELVKADGVLVVYSKIYMDKMAQQTQDPVPLQMEAEAIVEHRLKHPQFKVFVLDPAKPEQGPNDLVYLLKKGDGEMNFQAWERSISGKSVKKA